MCIRDRSKGSSTSRGITNSPPGMEKRKKRRLVHFNDTMHHFQFTWGWERIWALWKGLGFLSLATLPTNFPGAAFQCSLPPCSDIGKVYVPFPTYARYLQWNTQNFYRPKFFWFLEILSSDSVVINFWKWSFSSIWLENYLN